MKPLDRVRWTTGLNHYVQDTYPEQRAEILGWWLVGGIEIAEDQRPYDPPDMIAVRGIGQMVGFRVLVPRELVEIIEQAE